MNTFHKPAKTLNDDEGRKGRNTGLTTVKGILLPVDWDERGGITAVALSTADEKEFLVVKDEKGEQLLSLVRKELELTGIIKTCRNANTITVLKYRTKTGWDSM